MHFFWMSLLGWKQEGKEKKIEVSCLLGRMWRVGRNLIASNVSILFSPQSGGNGVNQV